MKLVLEGIYSTNNNEYLLPSRRDVGVRIGLHENVRHCRDLHHFSQTRGVTDSILFSILDILFQPLRIKERSDFRVLGPRSSQYIIDEVAFTYLELDLSCSSSWYLTLRQEVFPRVITERMSSKFIGHEGECLNNKK